jgi:hypothetical protein
MSRDDNKILSKHRNLLRIIVKISQEFFVVCCDIIGCVNGHIVTSFFVYILMYKQRKLRRKSDGYDLHRRLFTVNMH